MKRRNIIDPSSYSVNFGKKEYLADIPDGDQQIRYDIRADGEVEVYLGAGDLGIPIGNGRHITGTLRVYDARFIIMRCAETTRVAASIRTAPITRREREDDTPVDISVPEPMQINLQAMVSRLVGEALAANNADTMIAVDDHIMGLPDDVDPEFGPGFMEMTEDEEIAMGVRAKQKKVAPEAPPEPEAPKPPEASSKPVPANAGNNDVKAPA